MEMTILNPTPDDNDQFGFEVDISGDTLVVGAPTDDAGANNSGVAHLFVEPLNLVGTDQKDTLNGANGNDSLFGKKDNDLLFGGDGNDILAGDGESIAELLNEDPGNDTVVGGNGEDTLYVQKDDLLVGGGPGSSNTNSAFNQSLSDDPLKLSDTEKTNLGYFDGDADNFVFLDDGNGYTATIVGYESIDELDLSAFGVASAEDFVDSQGKDDGLWWEYKTPKSALDAEVVLQIDAAPNELNFL